MAGFCVKIKGNKLVLKIYVNASSVIPKTCFLASFVDENKWVNVGKNVVISYENITKIKDFYISYVLFVPSSKIYGFFFQ